MRIAPYLFLCAVALPSALTDNVAHAHALDHLRTTDDIGVNKIPNKGTSHILVIPAWVGEEAYPAEKLTELKKLYDPAGGPGTFRDYWQVMSGGRYDPIPTLVEPVVYPDSCPLPNRTVDNCSVGFEDIDLIASGGIRTAFEDILGRIRDEQDIDLNDFDVNSGSGDGGDGYFDGVITHSNIADGVAPPIAALYNETIVPTKPGGGGSMITLGVVAMAPPTNHEFAHNFGFIDLYGGPSVNGMMDTSFSGLSAFSRQQIGWGEFVDVTEPLVEFEMKPVLDGGKVLRLGSGPRYLLIENRGGAKHEGYDYGDQGLFVYSVDEDTLPTEPLGFLNAETSALYLPNAEAPYLNVALPVGCSILKGSATTPCAVNTIGAQRVLSHESGTETGYTLHIVAGPAQDGTYTVTVTDGTEAVPVVTTHPPAVADEGCSVGTVGESAPPWLLLLCGVLLLRRRERLSGAVH